MKNLLDKVVAKGADKGEIFYQQKTIEQIDFKGNKLNQVSSKKLRGINFKVVKDGKVGSISSSDLSSPDKMVDKVLEIVEYGDEMKYDFNQPGLEYPEYKYTDDRNYQESVETLVEKGEEIVKRILNYEENFQTEISIERSREETAIYNTHGLDLETAKDEYYIQAYGLLVEGDNFTTVIEAESAEEGKIDFDGIADRLIEKLKLARKVVSLESGKYSVIFTPRAVAQMCSALEGLYGENVVEGVSPVKDKVDQQIFSDKITIKDNGKMKDGLQSKTFDDEGTPMQETVLVENGILKEFIHSLESADKAETRATGNVKRGSYSNAGRLGFTNLIIEAGETSFDEMIKDIDEGMVIDNISGLIMGNTIQGNIDSDIDMGYKIENGKMVGRVKNGAIGTNIYKLLTDNLVAVEDQIRPMLSRGFVAYVPHILCQDVNVTIG